LGLVVAAKGDEARGVKWSFEREKDWRLDGSAFRGPISGREKQFLRPKPQQCFELLRLEWQGLCLELVGINETGLPRAPIHVIRRQPINASYRRRSPVVRTLAGTTCS
jgi:hypothetical protein